MSSFVKWNDLNQFHEVVKSLGHVRLYKILKENDYKITYGTKIKIHGTNAAIRIDPDGKVIAQKRSSDIIPGSKDNHGFAAWVKANEDFFAELAISNETQIIYGEWAGPGVQNNVACSMTANKIFYVFSIDYHDDNGFNHRLYDPVQITQQLEVFKGLPDDVMVLPWHNELIIDFETKTETEKVLWQLNSIVEQIGLRDPFFFDNFGIEGCGEGLVCYPLLGATKGIYRKDEIEQFSHFNFKAKSEAHRVNKTKAAAVFDPEKFANKNRFADAFCTEPRFEQGFKEAVNEVKDMKLTSQFIQWVCKDVFKESETERSEMATVPWADLSKVVSARAAIWYKERASTL